MSKQLFEEEREKIALKSEYADDHYWQENYRHIFNMYQERKLKNIVKRFFSNLFKK